MRYLVGIDLGSTSLKAIIYDIYGNVIASGSSPTKQSRPYEDHPDWVVWQPEQIWRGTASAIKQAVSQLDNPGDIKAVAVTGMGMDGVPMDEDGQWLYPFISWHDPRTQPQHDWWIDHIGAEKTFSIGGNTMWRFNTALRILWMMEHEPEILAKTHKWVLIEDFLNYMLCGTFATDFSMAACTLLFDQQKLNWSEDLLRLSGIDGRLMCDPFPSGTPIGEVTDDAAHMTGLPIGTPVVLGGHDYLCGALPVGGFKENVVLDITGTWEIVQVTVPQPILTPQLQKAGMTVEAHVARDTYSIWGGATAADMLEWYRNQYGFAFDRHGTNTDSIGWDTLMIEAATAPVGAKGILFLPHMSGSGCPVSDTASLGAFVGIDNQATRGDLLRALIEGLDYQFLDIVNTLEDNLNIKANDIVAVGGAIRNKFWMQNKADVTGRVIRVPEIREATALGAAILGGIGVGIYEDESDALEHVTRSAVTYEPDGKTHERYNELFPIYQQLYPALRSINHQLHSAFSP